MIENYITGGSGFIGRHLIDRLKHSCHVRNEELRQCRFDYVKSFFFLSTYGNMAHHVDHRKMVKANVRDLLTVIEVTNWDKGWLCYMSSSSVTLPVQTPYSRTKRAAEEILQALPELKSCIVRPYSVTGVGEQKEHLIPTLIRSCIEGEEMPFDPEPVHDFVDVEEVVNGLIRIADKGQTGIVEFGRGLGYSNHEVRTIVEDECNARANVVVTKKIREYDNINWYARRPFFKPKKSLEQSISEMVEAYDNERA